MHSDFTYVDIADLEVLSAYCLVTVRDCFNRHYESMTGDKTLKVAKKRKRRSRIIPIALSRRYPKKPNATVKKAISKEDLSQNLTIGDDFANVTERKRRLQNYDDLLPSSSPEVPLDEAQSVNYSSEISFNINENMHGSPTSSPMWGSWPYTQALPAQETRSLSQTIINTIFQMSDVELFEIAKYTLANRPQIRELLLRVIKEQLDSAFMKL